MLNTLFQILNANNIRFNESALALTTPLDRERNRGYEGKVALHMIARAGEDIAPYVPYKNLDARFIRFFELRRDMRITAVIKGAGGCDCDLCGKHELGTSFRLNFAGQDMEVGSDCLGNIFRIDGSGAGISR